MILSCSTTFHIFGNPDNDVTPLQLLSVHNPSCEGLDVHVMLKTIECGKRVWSTKCSQAKTDCHLYLLMRQRNKICRLPLVISCMKLQKKNLIRRNLQSNKYGNCLFCNCSLGTFSCPNTWKDYWEQNVLKIILPNSSLVFTSGLTDLYSHQHGPCYKK